jgi:hypothetical protein
MDVDKELSLYVDETSTSTVFKAYVDLFTINKNIDSKRIYRLNLSLAEAEQLRDFLNYCYPKP